MIRNIQRGKPRIFVSFIESFIVRIDLSLLILCPSSAKYSVHLCICFSTAVCSIPRDLSTNLLRQLCKKYAIFSSCSVFLLIPHIITDRNPFKGYSACKQFSEKKQPPEHAPMVDPFLFVLSPIPFCHRPLNCHSLDNRCPTINLQNASMPRVILMPFFRAMMI